MTSSAAGVSSVAATTSTYTSNPPSTGQLLYLASYIFRVNVTALTTMPDTPNQYSAQFQIMGDQGDLDLNNLVGPPGPPGTADFVLRDMTDSVIVNTVFELPDLQDTYEDIGLYWRLDTLDEYGYVIMETAYVWYGDGWRAFMMGTFGPPGPVPSVIPTCETIAPGQQSYVLTAGPTFQPSWIFNLAVPQGAWGPQGAVALFPDVEETAISPLNVLTATGYLESGDLLWQPLSIDLGLFAPYSVPQNTFTAYSGQSQQALVGSFALPPQPWNWTPVVWGHIGSIGGQGENGVLGLIISVIEDVIDSLFGGLSAAPSNVGCQVLLGNPTTGTTVARGFGNQTGVVNIYPHYSTPTQTSLSVSPTNDYAVVPSNHTDPEQGTLYINLYNDGAAEKYNFDPVDAQLFVAVIPIQTPYTSITGVPRAPLLGGRGSLTATLATLGTGAAIARISGTGTLSSQIGVIGG